MAGHPRVAVACSFVCAHTACRALSKGITTGGRGAGTGTSRFLVAESGDSLSGCAEEAGGGPALHIRVSEGRQRPEQRERLGVLKRPRSICLLMEGSWRNIREEGGLALGGSITQKEENVS